ncbi:hypothetical protein BGZ99_002108 [Dissophora globulifera]|uniref:HAUS augmin-like complex subunit 4 n=1 Tax=Dissophora globulifera TaxID=979702 RepID=A0A9P6RXR4_9FUNG|nr:hypothetical protein BGZ99_002108 [Dissophora globulifera]
MVQHLEASTAAQNTTATPVLEVLATRDIRHMAERIEGQELDRGHVLDLDGFTLEQLQPHLDALDGFSQPMTDAIQQSILQRAQDVIALFSRQSGIISLKPHWQDQPGSVNPPSSLSAVVLSVKNRLSALDKTKDEVVLHGTTIQDKAKDLFQIIHQSVALLWEILTEFMIRYQLEQDLTFKEYFTQVVESVALKLEILRVTMQDAVYDKDAVQQLVQVRDALESKRQALESQTRHNAMLLQQYQNAGNEFNTIVEAYADVMRRIDTVQDHIRRLE